jgi:hypothetical protein
MKNIFKAIISSLLLMLIFASLLVAGNGKIAGVVKDNNGKPVPGATVMLAGTKLGGFADVEGRYYVLNVPPGRYDVTFSAVGYNKKTIKSIGVSSDLTTEVNAVIAEAAVEVEGVVVEAERKLVDKTLTATRTTISADELSNTLPVSTTYELLQTAPSVYKGFVRGGKQDQTKSIVEGVDVSDQFYFAAATQGSQNQNIGYNGINLYKQSTQSSILSLNSNSIQEMTVNTGALGAEYSSASAGVINYNLKEGKGAIGGRAMFRSSAKKLAEAGPAFYADDYIYFNERAAFFANKTATDSIRAKRYTYKTGQYKIGQNDIEGELDLSGAINEDLGFYFSSNLKNNTDCRMPNESNRTSNSQLKLTYAPSKNIKVVGFGILTDRGELFGWKNTQYAEKYRYYLNGVPVNDGYTWVGSLKLTHFLSASTFYEAQLSNTFDRTRSGYVDANGDGIVGMDANGNFDLNDMTKGDYLDFTNTSVYNKYVSNTDFTKFFTGYPGNETDCQTQQPGIGNLAQSTCRPGIRFYDRKLNTTTAKIDLTSQVSYNHQVKAGVSYNYRTLDLKNQYGFFSGSSRSYTTEYYHVHPYDISAYASDRMEYAGLIINGGLRFDLWAPNASEFADYFKPYKYDSTYIPEDGTYYKYLSALRNTDKIKPRTFLSPRLAVSHPVSDNASIYFSFAKIQQNQPLSVIYADYNDIANLSNATISLVDRDPTISTKYEVGGQWAFLDNVSMDINAYYNNIQNYQTVSYGVTALSGAPSVTYYYFNAGYANARGVEMTLNLFPSKLADFVTVSGRLTYTYSFVRVSGVVPSTIGNFNITSFAVSATDSSKWKYRYGLPVNDYDNYTRVEVPVLSNNSALTGGYDRTHRVNYTMFFRFPYSISLTSIGLFQSGFKYTPKFNDPRKQGLDIKEAPWNTQVDLRLEKAFSFGNFRFAAYVDVKNVFNKSNLLAFDNSNTYSDAWETSKDPTGLQHRPVAGDGTPFYDIPRETYFGITFDF